TMTESMRKAISETNRRRAKQVAYNTSHGIDPQPLRKRISDITEMLAREDADTIGNRSTRRTQGVVLADEPTLTRPANIAQGELADLISELTERMHAAAADLRFEVAARLRDEVADLKKEYRSMVEGMK
ncbi:MAG: UvrB/UvrC motif-containing protein, partial [Propionibacteriaceae bacterium]|nr:UvrB/UvrC motif-containing protein [Propionibacteriaceae bacterium]